MKTVKLMMLSASSVAAVLFFSGCAMCNAPIPGDASCNEPSHLKNIDITPENISYTAPKVLPARDAFRPTFKAGTARVTATGSGLSLEDATNDAVAQILSQAKSDYLVAVTRVVSKKTHPTWRFFSTTNYSVQISALPIYLDKLEKVEKVENGGNGGNGKGLTKEEIIQIINVETTKIINVFNKQPKCPPPAMLNLTDINISMTAKGATKDPVGVIVPIPQKSPKK